MDSKFKQFFSQKIKRRSGVKLSDQLLTIMRSEIMSGRWSVGEAIPSYKELEGLTGLSQGPIQQALNALELEGLIKRVRQKGMFIQTLKPEQNQVVGKILLIYETYEYHSNNRLGIPVKTNSFGFWNMESIYQEAGKIGLETVSVNLDKIDSFDMPADVLGVISLIPAEEITKINKLDDLKIVYLGIQDPLSIPSISGDPIGAGYLLARYLLEKGHESPLLLADPKDPVLVKELIRLGYLKAHEEMKRIVKFERIQVEVDKKRMGPKEVRDILKKHRECSSVIVTNLQIARVLVSVCELEDIDIPNDLSVVSVQAGKCDDYNVEGIAYRWDEIIQFAFDMLLQKDMKHPNSMGRFQFQPILEEGDTVKKIK